MSSGTSVLPSGIIVLRLKDRPIVFLVVRISPGLISPDFCRMFLPVQTFRAAGLPLGALKMLFRGLQASHPPGSSRAWSCSGAASSPVPQVPTSDALGPFTVIAASGEPRYQLLHPAGAAGPSGCF